jgi:hypothetical protein
MSDNLTVTGVVEFFGNSKFNKDDYSLKVSGCDDWFGQPKEWVDEQLKTDGYPRPKVGDSVTFYRGKKKDGTPAKYIRALQVSGAQGVTQTNQVEEVGMLTKDRTIVRQNALNHATNLHCAGAKVPFASTDEEAMKIIDTAKLFEAYSMGDLDKLEADEATAQLKE